MVSEIWRLLLFFTVLTLMPIQPAFAEKQITVYTVNYPLAYFAERIGNQHVKVVFPAPPGIDPAFWTPNGETIGKYQKADLIFLNGARYAKWTKTVSLPMLRTVDTSKSFKDDFIAIETDITHSHGPSGDHSHSGTAFTTWLDFSQAAQQAEEIYQALSKKLVEHESVFKQNFEALKADLVQLDEQMKTLSSRRPGLPLFASHPIYQYMARRYGLKLQMVMWEPDEDPGENNWRNLETLQENHSAQWMIWEGTPLSGSVTRLEKMGIKSLIFSPCFNRPEEGDFLSVMKHNIEEFKQVFSQLDSAGNIRNILFLGTDSGERLPI